MIISYIIIAFLTMLILYDVVARRRCSIIEGATGDINATLDYKDPGLDQNPLYVATINASNITYLKSRLDEIKSFKTDLDAMKQQVESNTAAIQGINTGLQTTSASLVPDQETSQALVDSGSANAIVPT